MRRAMLTMEELMAMALPRSAAVVDHLHHEGLAAGHVEAVDDALRDAEDEDQGNGDVAGEGKRGEDERLQHGGGLRPDEHLAAVEAVDPDAGEGCEEEGGNLAGKADGAEQHGRSGEAVDEPGGGDAGHPRADEGDALAAERRGGSCDGEGRARCGMR